MHTFHASDYKYMNNGRTWNPQTLGGNYFKEITWNHLYHTYVMHTDAYWIINKMLRYILLMSVDFARLDLQYIMEGKGKTHTKNS
jgi:hypothetical protein